MWFYEWTHAEAQVRDEAMNILAVCDDEICQDHQAKTMTNLKKTINWSQAVVKPSLNKKMPRIVKRLLPQAFAGIGEEPGQFV